MCQGPHPGDAILAVSRRPATQEIEFLCATSEERCDAAPSGTAVVDALDETMSLRMPMVSLPRRCDAAAAADQGFAARRTPGCRPAADGNGCRRH